MWRASARLSSRVSICNKMVVQLRWALGHASEDLKCLAGPKMSSGSWQGWTSWDGSRAAGWYEVDVG